ncbi:hypothetical protein PHSY_005563 [Pseudozyma hubeiensis SY62]|uniref:Uncharacterized protein n=1 Tax=Pseudozyma hubeiensis (strain SY62) TaxID=1305764 RepID=R9PIP8_PSEHS|nr:hypothetical protein PHSY_005563 [Pseudozyma hubeiensis SY62]GAC97975.1 hypothetical protein PHSY_005563 [Pseudozyma hubeiensis SY62]
MLGNLDLCRGVSACARLSRACNCRSYHCLHLKESTTCSVQAQEIFRSFISAAPPLFVRARTVHRFHLTILHRPTDVPAFKGCVLHCRNWRYEFPTSDAGLFHSPHCTGYPTPQLVECRHMRLSRPRNVERDRGHNSHVSS